MAHITCCFLSLVSLIHATAQTYTSLESMPAWKSLPPGALEAVTIAGGPYISFPGCPTDVPELSTAVCFATLPEMLTSFVSYIIADCSAYEPSMPTQFQASATSVVKDWLSQPAVKAAVGTNTPSPTASSSATSTDSATASTISTTASSPKGFQALSTVAQVFTILGPIIGIAAIIIPIVLYIRGKRRPQQPQTRHRSWLPMNINHGQRGHFIPNSSSGSRNRTNTNVGDRINVHFYSGGNGGSLQGGQQQHPPQRNYDARNSDVTDERTASRGQTPVTWPPRSAITGRSTHD